MKRLMSLMLGMGLGGPSAMPAGSYTVLLGTYTRDRSEGIYEVQMDGETGKLSAAGLVQAMTDPEFLALHPHGRIVYALTREAPKEGGVVVLALDPATGGLTELDRGFVAGGTFCHLVVDPAGRRLMAASYDGGFTAHWALDAEGRLAGQGKTIEHGGELGPQGGATGGAACPFGDDGAQRRLRVRRRSGARPGDRLWAERRSAFGGPPTRS